MAPLGDTAAELPLLSTLMTARIHDAGTEKRAAASSMNLSQGLATLIAGCAGWVRAGKGKENATDAATKIVNRAHLVSRAVECAGTAPIDFKWSIAQHRTKTAIDLVPLVTP